MKLEDAIKSGREFKRKHWGNWMKSDGSWLVWKTGKGAKNNSNAIHSINVDDILADDWEIKEEWGVKVDIKDLLDDYPYNTFSNTLLEEILKRTAEKRNKILDDFLKAYLAEHSGIKSTDEIELVQTAACDGTGISFYFRKKEHIEKWFEGNFKEKYPAGVLCFARNDSEWKKDIITDYEVGRIYPFRGTRDNWIYTKFISKNEIPVILTKED